MKRLATAVALAVFGLAPGIGAACDYNDVSTSASAAPTQTAPADQAASKTSAPVAKAPATTTVKQTVAKAKAPASDLKLAAGTTK